MSDCGAASLTEGGAERLERLAVPTGRGPDQPAGVVIDHDRDVAVALLVADLINPDPAQPFQRVPGGDAVGDDPRHDRPDRAPGDPQQRLQRRLRRAGGHPGDGVLQDGGVPGVVPRPRHPGDDHPVLAAGHPRRVGFQVRPVQPKVRCPPLPAALALVIARTAPLTTPTPPLGALTRPDREDRDLGLVVELDAVDHRRSLDPEHTCPYLVVAHAVPRSVVLDFDTQNLSRDGVSLVQPLNERPRKRPESRKSLGSLERSVQESARRIRGNNAAELRAKFTAAVEQVSDQAVLELVPLVGAVAACSATGRARATHYRRHRTSPAPQRAAPVPHVDRVQPAALSAQERTQALAVLHSERFCDAAPAQVWATLLDENIYLACESTFYRLLRGAHGDVRERRSQATHPAKVKPELIATKPNEVWSWDITKLHGPAKWT